MNGDAGVRFSSRLYYRLLRSRLISEPQWGQPSALSRLLRIRLLPALGLSMPALLLCSWYLLLALGAHLRHRAEVTQPEPLSIELFQLLLHDKLVHDWHILRMPEPQRKSSFPTYGLLINSEKLERAIHNPTPDAQTATVIDGQLIRGNRAFEAQLRYGRGNYWRSNSPQKSWQVRLKNGKVLDGFNDFTLVKSPDLMSVTEKVMLDITRSSGLLTPAYFPARLLLNKAYMGVYYFDAQPNEALLRSSLRAPGSIYSGNEANNHIAANRSLFASAENFNKVTQGVHQELGDRRELDTLIWTLNQPSSQVFVTYAEAHLDLDKFALLDAFDIVLGCNQHARSGDEKLYFDPYRDKFEPIAGHFRNCTSAMPPENTDTLLQIRLKQVPEYLPIRNRNILELLRNSCSPESVRERVQVLLGKLGPEQERDPFWDAAELLPAMGDYYTQLMRPANRKLQARVNESRIHNLALRNRHLSATLQARNIRVELTPLAPSRLAANRQKKQIPIDSALDITVNDDSTYQLTQLATNWPPDCRPTSFSLSADRNLDDQFDGQVDAELGAPHFSLESIKLSLELYSGFRLEGHDHQTSQEAVRVVPEARRYRLFIRAQRCAPAGVNLQISNIATGESFPIHVNPSSREVKPSPLQSQCTDTFRVEAGQSYPHLWCTSEEKPQKLVLGPGDVEVSETKEYSKLQAVTIAPGTTLRMGQNASLVFRGRLDARGTRELPIRILPTSRVWGGVALQGLGTAGSRLDFVQIEGGSRPEPSLAYYPGTLDIHDTKDIALDHLSISNSQQSESALHVADTIDISLRDSTLSNIASSAVEMEFSSGTIDHLEIFKVKKDALILRGVQASLRNLEVFGWEGNGISLSQRSNLTIRDALLAAGNRGISVNEASTMQYDGILLYRNDLGLDFEQSSDWYSEHARIKGDQLYAVDCKTQIRTEGASRKTPVQFKGRPQSGELERLRVLLVGSNNWDVLDKVIEQRLRSGAP